MQPSRAQPNKRRPPVLYELYEYVSACTTIATRPYLAPIHTCWIPSCDTCQELESEGCLLRIAPCHQIPRYMSRHLAQMSCFTLSCDTGDVCLWLWRSLVVGMKSAVFMPVTHPTPARSLVELSRASISRGLLICRIKKRLIEGAPRNSQHNMQKNYDI